LRLRDANPFGIMLHDVEVIEVRAFEYFHGRAIVYCGPLANPRLKLTDWNISAKPSSAHPVHQFDL
jgi:hypothetical protein